VFRAIRKRARCVLLDGGTDGGTDGGGRFPACCPRRRGRRSAAGFTMVERGKSNTARGELPRRAARAVVNAAQMCLLAAGLDYLCTTPLLFDFSAGVDGPTQQSTVIDIDAPASADDRYLEHILYDIRSYFPPPAYAAKF